MIGPHDISPRGRIRVADSGCWEWIGYRTAWGYGWKGGRHVHRIAYELAFGSIPNGLFVCHSCDNPPCCNPAHLWLGTTTDNIRDAVAKGRLAQQRRTHCPQDHPYDEANTYRLGKRRWCRVCVREKAKQYMRRKRAGLAVQRSGWW